MESRKSNSNPAQSVKDYPLQHTTYSVLSHNIQDYNSVLMWAACCTAFLGLLHCSKFTVPLINDYDPTAHLSLQDIANYSHTALTEIR